MEIFLLTISSETQNQDKSNYNIVQNLRGCGNILQAKA